MAGQIVYDDVVEGASENLRGQLFAEKKFFVTQRIPSRNRYLSTITSNGGTIVALEKKADYIIADHFRRDCPPGSISYTFIDQCIKDGGIVDPEDHLAGPQAGASREVGSIGRPGKVTRTPYTPEDDRILYKWVRDHERQGGSASGNELYKALAAQHPRHPWQSWRDRYLKQLKDRPPTGLTVPDNAPPSPPLDQAAEKSSSKPPSAAQPPASQRDGGDQPAQSGHKKKSRAAEHLTIEDFDRLFDTEQWEELYANVPHILECSAQNYIEGWETWAKTTSRTADEWRQYFERVVRPQWARDPESKKETIRKKVAKRHEDEEAQASQQAEESAQQRNEIAADSPMADVDEEQAQAPSVVAQSGAENQNVLPNALSIDEAFSPSTPKRKRASTASISNQPPTFEALVDKFLEERQGRPPQDAYIFWAQKEKQTIWADNPGLGGATFAARDIAHATSTYYVKEVHRILKPRWKALSDEEKAPFLTMEAADKKRHEMEQVMEPELSSEMDTSTVAQETPLYVQESYEKIMKRIHNDTVDDLIEEVEASRRAKRRKSISGSPSKQIERLSFVGTRGEPVEISSAEDSPSLEPTDESQEQGQTEDVNMEDAIQAELQTESMMEDIVQETEDNQPTPTVEGGDLSPQYPHLPTSNVLSFSQDTHSPITPRQGQKKKASAFDTQAIMSSPSQGFPLTALPRPAETQAQEPKSRSASLLPSSPVGKQESVASTTQSMQEFRRSVNDDDGAVGLPERSVSVAPSEADSQGSGDPDEPLRPDELDDFFDAMQAEDFLDDEITAALKHTRMRPNLAQRVLNAWKDHLPLPNARGIWSIEDDTDVESGDGIALARLERKHTVDGWGGITERLRFLETCRG